MTVKLEAHEEEGEPEMLEELIDAAARAVACWGYAAIAVAPVVLWAVVR